jgi:hypothetical protein
MYISDCYKCIEFVGSSRWVTQCDGCYGLDDWGSIPSKGRDSFLATAAIPAVGSTQPPIQLVPWGLSLRINRAGRDADHSLPSSAELKNEWSMPLHNTS